MQTIFTPPPRPVPESLSRFVDALRTLPDEWRRAGTLSDEQREKLDECGRVVDGRSEEARRT